MAHNPNQSVKLQRRPQEDRELKGRKGLKMNQWTEDRMKGAIEAYKEQVESGRKPALRLLARTWNVPKTTLQRRVKGLVEGSGHASGRKPFIPIEAERELAILLTSLLQKGFPLKKTDVQTFAFEFAKRNGIRGFSEEKQKAGYYWFEGFMKRNPGLKIKKPGALSPTSTLKLNEEELGPWFRTYETSLHALGIKDVPSHIWKCDISGLQGFSSDQFIGEAGEPCFETTTEEEEETSITVLATFNAIGTYAPPLIIFKGNNVSSEWLNGCPENVCVRSSDNGWITAEMLVEWGEIFIAQLPKEDARPHLLLLDGQSIHVFNLNFLSLMKENKVEVICYPVMNPANRALFGRLKYNWCEVRRKLNRQCAGTKLPKSHYHSVFLEAWKKTATVENAQDGFSALGMFPINQFAVSSEVLTPSAKIEHELPPATYSILSHLQSNTVPTEEYAHSSAENSSVVGEASFKDFVVMPKRDGIRTHSSIDHFLCDENSKQKNKTILNKRTKCSYKCRGCFSKCGSDDDPKASEVWIRCSNCKACYHESCAEQDGIYEWVYDLDDNNQET
ncbi:uncharacterized protein si:rp71-1d10.8 [Xyrauchen texanus]|uniref:uncharacterized protein si:rp71-1d10.8 n=1 Tax=Xyrauchen texanus TaxID=154827 RepID=UPI00224292DB|nr:uncharacterized protein si:rp71-1d10.8 [Xyrauchen texanus]